MAESLMVAVIDFGTTFSGYAFSTKAEFENNKLNIKTNQAWKPGNVTIKCPTCILFDEKKEFISFGYHAEDDYVDILMDKKQNEFYFFSNFKMILYTERLKSISSDELIVEDLNGKPLSAKFVFSECIKAIADHFHTELESRGILGVTIKKDEITWVLTVPTIWTESAKTFMHICAKKAGLGNKLKIALEPEVASIYCQCEMMEHELHSIGSKLMVVDIGGGTTDIVVQEKQKHGQLKNLCTPSGDRCGGTDVDKMFLRLISDILGKEVMESFKRDFPLDYLELRRLFEVLKQRRIDGKPIRTSIPLVSLNKLCQNSFKNDFPEVLKKSKHKDDLKYVTGDKIEISKDLFLSQFQATTLQIVKLIEETSIHIEGISKILLVGGFSESSVVQDAVKKAFPDKQVIIPKDSSIAVLKGAVLYGHNPNIISSRIVRYSYGISSTEKYDPKKHHNNSKIIEIDGVLRCRDTFHKLITANTSVSVGDKRSHTFKTIEPNQKFVNLRIYYSTSEIPLYIDEIGCEKFGEIKVEIQKPSRNKVEIDVEFCFGLTELVISAKEKERDQTSTLSIKY